MKIEKLDIKGFGKFNNLIIGLGKGLNIVYGENEAGKTTIQWFIRGMLYSLKGGRSGKDGAVPPLKRYKPWNGNDYRGTISYRLDDGSLFTVERDFNDNTVKVYDSFYNDITGTFDQSRDKGPLFAIKHLGINESCFEKTVFIGQMDTRVDTQGSSELIDKLSNISETGSEDISLNRAREVLKNAQISYVGTDKTTTRPLDVVNSKLDELNNKKKSLIIEREALFGVGERINQLNNLKKCQEERREALTYAKQALDIRRNIEDLKKQRKDLASIFGEIKKFEEESNILRERIDEYNKVEQQHEAYSDYTVEDSEVISVLYSKLEDTNRENGKLYEKLKALKEEVEVIEASLEEFKAFNTFEDDVEEKLQIFLDSIDRLELDKKEINTGLLDESIKTASSQDRLMKTGVMYSGFAAVISGVLALFTPFRVGGIVAACVFTLLSVAIIYMRTNIKDRLKEWEGRKDKLLLTIQNIDKELFSKKEGLKLIFEAAGVKGMGEFVKKKAMYESLVQQFTRLNISVDGLEDEIGKSEQDMWEVKTSIIKRLREYNIIALEENEIKSQHIEKFKYGLNRYRKALSDIEQAKEKLKDRSEYLESLYDRASSLYMHEFYEKDDITKAFGDINRKVERLYESIEVCSYRIKAIYSTDDSTDEYDELIEKMVDADFLNAQIYIEDSLHKITDDINETMLNISKSQALIDNATSNEDELQRVEREILELEEEKVRLQDIGFSLKTALSTLEEASLEIKRDFAPALNQKLSSMISAITDERYKEIRADDSLVLRTLEPDTGHIAAATLLSGGTVDQMYLALRISLAEVVENGGEILPLIMDEIFAHYDDKRVSNTLRMLQRLSESRQIILFTCKEREAQGAREVFDDDLNIIRLD